MKGECHAEHHDADRKTQFRLDMNIATVQLECTLEERIQARKRLVAALAAIVEERIMRHTPVQLSDGVREYLEREPEQKMPGQ